MVTTEQAFSNDEFSNLCLVLDIYRHKAVARYSADYSACICWTIAAHPGLFTKVHFVKYSLTFL